MSAWLTPWQVIIFAPSGGRNYNVKRKINNGIELPNITSIINRGMPSQATCLELSGPPIVMSSAAALGPRSSPLSSLCVIHHLIASRCPPPLSLRPPPPDCLSLSAPPSRCVLRCLIASHCPAPALDHCCRPPLCHICIAPRL
jgi:hypothetical protein